MKPTCSASTAVAVNATLTRARREPPDDDNALARATPSRGATVSGDGLRRPVTPDAARRCICIASRFVIAALTVAPVHPFQRDADPPNLSLPFLPADSRYIEHRM
ncbi:hypothetical protein [Paraburkholderia caballeronis]|uniref:hypothetical protein n=1 Tax=Paraburkholderia caballeronis TaxID=416943 RepID=UPI001FBAA041|nr:hypothetical protein [Paraburkholderia caballeronis]